MQRLCNSLQWSAQRNRAATEQIVGDVQLCVLVVPYLTSAITDFIHHGHRDKKILSFQCRGVASAQ